MSESAKLVDESELAHTYAAIDLGSNSFHMVLATPEGDSIRIIDSLRAPVRLAAGLDKSKKITPKTEKYALDTLAQFAQRLRGVPRKNVSIVGTSTLRRAKNSKRFSAEAYNILRKRIETISGREEARLIYGSVIHTFPRNQLRRLVIDIGGGSTEMASGSGAEGSVEPDIMESMNMGCVSFSEQWFEDGIVDATRMKGASVHAQLELQPVAQAFKKAGWDEVIGCSGTIKATAKMLFELGLADGDITMTGLKKLQKIIIKAGNIENLELESISKDRMQVIAGGIAIIAAMMKTLEIEQIQVSQVALREGLIFEMIGRAHHVDIQQQTVKNLINRFQIDTVQSERVSALASMLFKQAQPAWDLERDVDQNLLHWASDLHEIGMVVAHTQYHKHGAYLLENSDLLGFTRAEQAAIGLLVRYHRRKFSIDAFEQLPSVEMHRLLKLTVLLRMAVLLLRSRQEATIDDVKFQFKPDRLHITATEKWIESHPLTRADLLDEANHLLLAGIELKVTVH